MTNISHIPVVGNADQKFFPGLYVAFLSILNAASGNHPYRFYILDGGLSEEMINELTNELNKLANSKGIPVSLCTLQVDETKLNSLPPRRGSRMPYAKLILPDLLPEEDYVIYADADILYNAGVESLYHETLASNNWLLSGVRDYHGTLGNECPWKEQLSKEEHQRPYINSGLMVMHLKAFRENGILDKAIKLRAEAGEQRLGDQSVFNFICRGNILLNPPRLNHLVALGSGLAVLEHASTNNLHFIGKNKPWLAQPNISQYSAHLHWHQFADTFNIVRPQMQLFPPNKKLLKRHKVKVWTNLFNPKRSRHYRRDLASINNLTH